MNGRDVASADLDEGQRIELPELILIPMSADAEGEFHLFFDSPRFPPISPQTSPAGARRQGAGHCLQSRAFRRPSGRR